MQQLDYDHTMHERHGAGDEALLVKFFIKPAEDQKASKEAGRPIFHDIEWIDIRIPGNKDNVVCRPLRQRDIERFPRHYAAFKQRIEKGAEAVVGTPLELFPFVTAARVEELKFFNIRTVEQLAATPDSTAGKFMGFHDLKKKAQDFMRASELSAPAAKIAELEQSNKELREAVDRLTKQTENTTTRGAKTAELEQSNKALREEVDRLTKKIENTTTRGR